MFLRRPLRKLLHNIINSYNNTNIIYFGNNIVAPALRLWRASGLVAIFLHKIKEIAPVAQVWIERGSPKAGVGRSNRPRGTILLFSRLPVTAVGGIPLQAVTGRQASQIDLR